MEKITCTGFGTLSMLGIVENGEFDENGSFAFENSIVTYHLEFEEEFDGLHHEGTHPEHILRSYRYEKYNFSFEGIGDNSYLIRETFGGEVRNPKGLLHGRMNNLRQVFRGLLKGVSYTPEKLPKECEN